MTFRSRPALTAEIITIGDELLKGSVLNTNAQFLGKELTDLGFRVYQQASCRDQIPEIENNLKISLQRSDLVILSGGLGPTPDDLTREAVAGYFKVPLKFSSSQYSQIKRHYRRYGYCVPPLVKREAFYPEPAVPLINRHGIALGFYVPRNGRLLVVLPGVPAELQGMFRELVRPLIRKKFSGLGKRPSLLVKMAGISEPDVMKRLGKEFFRDPFDFGIYPEAGEVSIRIYANTPAIIRRLKIMVRRKLHRWVYALEDISLAEGMGKILRKRRQTLAVAESCTGGFLSAEITKIPGASDYFFGGVIAYVNTIKEGGLGVPAKLLAQKGAVSKETALAMADGIRRQMNTTYGIGITGIAGPGGGTRTKPAGLVYIALATPRRQFVFRDQFWGNRQQVQIKAAKRALEYLWREIR